MHFAIYLENGRSRIGKQRLDLGADQPELAQQLAHMLRAAAGGRLIGHARHPFDEIVLEQPMHAHQHAAHCAIAADIVLDAFCQRILDYRHVYRIKNDDGVILHAQSPGRVYPVTIPSRRAQPGIDCGGVVATLAGDDHVHRL